MTANPKDNARNTPTTALRRLLIGLVSVAGIAGAGYFVYQQQARAQETGATEQAATQTTAVTVVTTPAAPRNFERNLVVQGNVEAKDFAVVSPRIGGVIEAIFVDEGDPVVAGETQLFQTDSVTLTENVQIRRHDLTVAQCAMRQAEANLEKIGVDLNKARLDYERFTRLREKDAVTVDAFEQQQSRYRQLEAAAKLARAQVDLASAQANQAEAALVIAEKNLADATVYAPITSVVTRRTMEPGEMGSPGEPILHLADTSVVEIAAFLPAQYYASVIEGQTQMDLAVSGIDVGRQVISYRSPTIEPTLRTFEIKCTLTDPPEGVVPGAMAQMRVVLESREGLGVPSEAILTRGGQSVLFVVSGSVARQVAVTTGIEADGWTEILEGDLRAGAAVVTMGQTMVADDTPVTVQQEAN
jgi:RND family efflux transporter MFP subunit